MADALEEALKITQQSLLANNPYAQFGSTFSQIKNPYQSDNPWENIAASAAQSLIGGAAMGYGGAKTAQEIQKLAPVVGQLYADPSKAVNPGIDEGVFGNLVLAGEKQQASTLGDLKQLIAETQVKNMLNPEAGNLRTKGLLDQVTLLEKMQELGLTAPQQAGQPLAQNATPEVPVAGETKQAVKSVGSTDKTSLLQQKISQYMAVPGTKRSDAMKLADKDLEAERTKEVNADRQAGESKAKQAEGFQERLAAANKTLSNLDMATSSLKAAVEDSPDYGGMFGSVPEFYDKNIGARILSKGQAQTNSQKKLNAAKTLSTLAPDVVGPLIKEALSGPTSDRDLAFFLNKMPSQYETKGEQVTAVSQLAKARDYSKFKSLFMNSRLQLGREPAQIDQEFETIRSALGGSFIDEKTGTLKPQVNGFIAKLGGQ